MKFVKAITNWIKDFALGSQRLFYFSLRTIASIFGRPIYGAETLEQMYQVGVGSLFFVLLTGISAGQAMALQFANELADFGSKNYLGRVMAIAIIRELGPVLTGLMVAARVAAGITAEIGSMKSSKQIDALVAFGIEPLKKLAAPRLIALMIMVPVLTVLADVIALVGGWVIAIFLAHITSTTYWVAVKERLIFGNIFVGVAKPVVFALIIAFVSCYKGFMAEGGTKGVGKATTDSVVISSITILVSNFVVTKVVISLLKGYL